MSVNACIFILTLLLSTSLGRWASSRRQCILLLWRNPHPTSPEGMFCSARLLSVARPRCPRLPSHCPRADLKVFVGLGLTLWRAHQRDLLLDSGRGPTGRHAFVVHTDVGLQSALRLVRYAVHIVAPGRLVLAACENSPAGRATRRPPYRHHRRRADGEQRDRRTDRGD